MDRISAALGITGIDATVEKVSGTDAIFNLKNINLEKLAPLYEKYGTAIAPVLFINGEMVLYGGVPSVERLVEVLGKANAPAPS